FPTLRSSDLMFKVQFSISIFRLEPWFVSVTYITACPQVIIGYPSRVRYEQHHRGDVHIKGHTPISPLHTDVETLVLHLFLDCSKLFCLPIFVPRPLNILR